MNMVLFCEQITTVPHNLTSQNMSQMSYVSPLNANNYTATFDYHVRDHYLYLCNSNNNIYTMIRIITIMI